MYLICVYALNACLISVMLQAQYNNIFYWDNIIRYKNYDNNNIFAVECAL